MKIVIANFEGLQPRLSAHLLRDSQGQIAENCRVEKGDLRAWREGAIQDELEAANYKSLHLYISATLGSNWVYSTNDLDFAKSAIAGDQFERLYFTGEATPRAFANDLDSDPWDHTVDYYKFGAAKPAAAAAFVSGHTGGSSYRAYVYTYVTRYGEETGPSPVLETTTYNTGDVVLGSFTQPPAGYALRTKIASNAPKIRLYRTMSSVDNAEFQFVKEFDIDAFNFSTGTCTDDVSDANLGEVLPTELYEGIPSDLKGLIGLTNGIFAGFRGNELCLSEPYLPHAWPDEYRMSFDYDIVGIGNHGTNIIVFTKGYNYLVVGEAPEVTQKLRLPGLYPCTSKRGIVSTQIGVLYPSHEGLIKASPDGNINILSAVMTPTEWADYGITTIAGYFYSGKYFGFYTKDTVSASFIFDIEQSIFTTNLGAYKAGYIKISDGSFYVIDEDNNILLWEGDIVNYQYYKWKSKKFLLPSDMDFTCAQVIVDLDLYNDVITLLEENNTLATLNASIFSTGDIEDPLNYYWFNYDEFNGSALYDLSYFNISNVVNFKLFVDGEKITERQISNDKMFRLPAARGRRLEIQLEGFIPVRKIVIAQSPQELN